MFRNTGNAVREVMDEPHDEGVRPFRLDDPDDRRGFFELATGDHVGLACRCGALASGALSVTVGRHIHSIRAKPHVLDRAVK
jgi:hypothetical protein